ncbi:type IV pilus biogenesis protein PilM [Marinicrinis sediminis]|uniref:Type IV pilus biogenesis protein PilM n=1 Tax=Marinicrinis sediminis TaxID=1652465 RepID=A0ABW5RC10_9BACL
MFGKRKGNRGYGIQILDQCAKIVEVERTTKSVRFLRQQEIALEEEIVRGGKILSPQTVASQIGQAVREMGISGAEVTLTVPTSEIALRKTAFSKLKDKDMRNLIDVEIHANNTFPFKNPVFDYIRLGKAEQEAAATSENGKKAAPQEDVLIIATSQEVVDNYREVLENAGLQPVAIDLAPLALQRILAYAKVSSAPAHVIIHCEHEYADIVIFEQGVPVFIRQVQQGASYMLDMTNDAMEAYGRHLSIELGRILNYYKYSISAEQKDVEQLFLSARYSWMEPLRSQLQSSFNGRIDDMPIRDLLKSDNDELFHFAVPLGLAIKG